MASGDSLTSTVNNDPTIFNKLDIVIYAIKYIKNNQDGTCMKRMFESKLRKRFTEKCWRENKIITRWTFYGLWCRNSARRWNYGNYSLNTDTSYRYGTAESKVSDEGTVMNPSITNPLDCTVLTVTASGIPIMKMMTSCKKLMIS